MSENKHASPAAWVDPDDAPELTDAFFTQADEYVGERLIRRGRPRTDTRKLQLTVRYDAEIVEAFRATGPGWQSRMNAALKDWLKQHTPGQAA